MNKSLMHRLLLFVSALLLIATHLQAADYISNITLQKGERWWGVFVAGGPAMPLTEGFDRIDLATYTQQQTTPFLVSNRGRYIWSAQPFAISFTGDSFLIESPHEKIEAVSAGKSLREAYLVCCHKNFPPEGKVPAEEFVRAPVYDTGVELGFDATGAELLAYADQILSEGYPAGTLVISSGWQSSPGQFQPNQALYGNLEEVIRTLHDKGFKVMLAISPFVSGDGPMYRRYRGTQNAFLYDERGKLIQAEWKGGYSALYDLTNPEVTTYIQTQISALTQQYGVDGFLFDCGGALSYMNRARGGVSEYWNQWISLGEGNELIQYTLSRGAALSPYIRNIQPDVTFDWNYLHHAVEDLLTANLLAYPYTTLSINLTPAQQEQLPAELWLRYVQLSSLLPVMNIGFAPWKMQDKRLAEACKAAMAERTRLSDYYANLIKESARTAEPILRHMEYAFPRNGFTDCDDQFMLGSKYLVAPILSPGDSREVRFPRGKWQASNGKIYRGPLVAVVKAEPNKMLIFELIK